MNGPKCARFFKLRFPQGFNCTTNANLSPHCSSLDHSAARSRMFQQGAAEGGQVARHTHSELSLLDSGHKPDAENSCNSRTYQQSPASSRPIAHIQQAIAKSRSISWICFLTSCLFLMNGPGIVNNSAYLWNSVVVSGNYIFFNFWFSFILRWFSY